MHAVPHSRYLGIHSSDSSSCRIVHTKGESGDIYSDPIYPFTGEAALLYHDIALVQYIADRSSLIKASLYNFDQIRP